MSIERLILLGAGGHAKVVLDALARGADREYLVEVVDENPARSGTRFADHVVTVTPASTSLQGAHFHVAIGSAESRARLHKQLTSAGAHAKTIVHPAASIAVSAAIGDGSFVAAHAVVAPDARVEASVILNHGAIVDHDCVVGAFSHIAPNATLGGCTRIGTGVLVGAGATILPGVKIGDRSVIAAGATIVRDVAAGEKVIYALVRKYGTSTQ